MKKIIAIFVCLLFVGTILAASVFVVAPKPPKPPGGGKPGDEPGTEYRITDGLPWEECPHIDGNLIVWHAYTTSITYDLFLYDLGDDGIPFTADDGGERQLTDTPFSEDKPIIYGNKLVFRRDYGASQDVRDMWLYDLDTDTEYQLTENVDFRTPDIYENMIVYWIWKPGPIRELWIYDLGADGLPSEDDLNYKISECDGGHWPKIDGNKVVFEWNDDLNIYYLSGNLAGQTVAMGLNYRPRDMEIHGNRIVWIDDRNGDYDVFTYDLGPDGEFGTFDDGGEQQISTTRYGEGRPSVYGDRIVWHNYISKGQGKWNIYMYDLIAGKEYTITTSNHAKMPIIYDDHIVYWDDREGDWDIYLYILN